MIATDFLGRIIHFSGPFPGKRYDAHIWERFGDRLSPGELLLADGHFTTIENMLCPIREDQVTRVEHEIFNRVLQHYRSRAEHAVWSLVRHEPGRKLKYRGSLLTLGWIMKLLAHTQVVQSNLKVRYYPLGPWPHIPVEEQDDDVID